MRSHQVGDQQEGSVAGDLRCQGAHRTDQLIDAAGALLKPGYGIAPVGFVHRTDGQRDDAASSMTMPIRVHRRAISSVVSSSMPRTQAWLAREVHHQLFEKSDIFHSTSLQS